MTTASPNPAASTDKVVSADGTTLAVDVQGSGTPVILIGGAFNDRSTVAALAASLAPHHTVLTYDRRRRAESDDRAADYLPGSELSDLAAVIAHAGGHAAVFGHSSGGVLALAGAIAGLPVDRVAIYETPFRVDGNREVPPAGHFERLTALLRAGDRDGAAALFLTENVGVPAEMVDHMRAGEGWDFMVQGAEGLPYDVLLLGPDLEFPAAGLSALTVPVLALYGDQTWPWLAEATKAVARTVPGARLVEVPGEDHGVLAHPEALRPALVEFLSS